MDLVLTISQISILTGHNIYQSKRDYLINLWKKTNNEDYEKYKSLTGFELKDHKTVFQNISKKNNLELNNDLYKCYNSKNAIELEKNKQDLLLKVKDLNEKDKKEITDSIMNLSNTRFGVKNETDICKIYEQMMDCEIVKDNLYVKEKVIEDKKNKFSIILGGKIDGINKKDGTIIEIKNRMNKLFYELRGYEKVQLMCYLHLFKAKKGFLVEAYKKNDGVDVNVIECEYDNEMMSKIINILKDFGKYYVKFLKNHSMKMELLNNEEFEVIF